MSQTNLNKMIDALRVRLFWMKYGVYFLRAGRRDLTRLKVGRQAVRLSLPSGEEATMTFEINNIFYNDCYGLGKLNGDVHRILDVGGNVGLFSLAARSHFPQARIHTYEPNPGVQGHLRNNTQGLAIEVHAEAIGAAAGWIEMRPKGSSLFAVAVPSTNGRIKKTPITDALDRLDGAVDLLKLDCEGAEWELLESPEIWKRIKRLTMEYHLWARPGVDVPELVGRIRRLGFRITHLCEEPEWGIVQATQTGN